MAINGSVGAARLHAHCRPIDILLRSHSRLIGLLCQPIELNRLYLSNGQSESCFLTIPLYIDLILRY